jgi:hypothetical protein
MTARLRKERGLLPVQPLGNGGKLITEIHVGPDNRKTPVPGKVVEPFAK